MTFHAIGVAPVEWDSLASFRGVVQGDMTRYAIAKPEPLAVELTAFRDAVRGTSNGVVPIRDAARVVGVAEALLRSSVTAETESLSSLDASR